MTNVKTPGRFLIALACASSTFFTHAQTVPDAGSLLQQIERDRQALPKRPLQPDATQVPPELTTAPGISVTVTRFAFVGNTLLPTDQLGAALASYLNRPLQFAELQKAAATVAERYRQAGWVVRAYLPKQEIDSGTVTIQIVEGRFGSTLLDGDAPKRFPVAKALRYITPIQKPGEPVNAYAIDRAAMLLDDLPGLSTTYTFRAGQAEGQTDLILMLGDTPVFFGSLDGDNTGARSTGDQRLSVMAYLDSALGQGDQATANLIKTEGSNYARLGFSLPLGYTGLRVGVNASHIDYWLITPEWAASDIRGNATTTGLEASYPLLRSRQRNLNVWANLDLKAFDNWSSFGPTSQYNVDVLTLGLSGNSYDMLGGGGANSANLSLTAGSVDLSGSANQANDAASAQTEGHYTKLKLSVSRNQSVTDQFSIYGQLALQRANRNLDSSEKLTLGGSSGVRAYPSGEAIGADGQTLSLEARFRLPQGFSITGFYDWGRITAINHDNITPNTLNAYSLSGYGLSASWVSPHGLQLKGSWAHRLGSNPNPTPDGLDQDGSQRINRFWLTASLPF